MRKKIISHNEPLREPRDGEIMFKIQKRYLPPFLEDIPVIRAKDEDVCRILDLEDYSIEQAAKEWSSGDVHLPFKTVATEITMFVPEKNVSSTYRAQFTINDNGTMDIVWGTRHGVGNFEPILKYSVFIDRYKLTSDTFLMSKEQCQKFGEEQVLNVAKSFFEQDMWREIQETFFITMSYLSTYKNTKAVSPIYEREPQSAANTSKTGKTSADPKRNSGPETIRKISVSPVIDLGDAIKYIRHYSSKRPCEYQFQRRGHWAQSKKTGKKWWVKEATVNADKPPKRTVYELDV